MIKVQIERPFIEAMIEEFPDLAALNEQLRFGDRVEVAFSQLSDAQLRLLGDLYRQAGPGMQLRAAQLSTLRQALKDNGVRFGANDLEMVLPAIVRYLLTGAIRGWVFTANVATRPLPYVITRLDFTPASNEEAPRLFIELKANAKGAVAVNTVKVTGPDIDGKTIGEIFAAKGFLKETPELIAAYDETIERYFSWRAQYGGQFSGRGTGFYAEDPNSSHRDMDWSRKDIVVLSTTGAPARLVNDESILTSRALTLDVPGEILAPYLRKASKSSKFDAEDEVRELQAALPEGLFTKIPIHAFILMFHLELHHYLWVHVDDMEPYRYKPALKQKLVLPAEQTDLIDILTAEMDLLMDDIVAGKSGGTTVLCAGPPGVGKTLTAEVYSEIIRRPLYRVHSGQLGLNVAAMENALKEILTRAQRWGAVMLIDEADVYIKRRDDDMTMNAVVGVFLRVLEYFNGLLFLTTNRVDDIDEAIVSRCIALIKYYPPDGAARRKIWRVMVDQFGLDVDEHLIGAPRRSVSRGDRTRHQGPCQTGRKILSPKAGKAVARRLQAMLDFPRHGHQRRGGALTGNRSHRRRDYGVQGAAARRRQDSATTSPLAWPSSTQASTSAVSKPASQRSPTCISGRRISSLSSSIRASAAASSSDSGCTSPDFTRGAARLNHSVTGRAPKNARNRAAVQGSVRRLCAMTVWPEAASSAFCRALPPQPGFSQNRIVVIFDGISRIDRARGKSESHEANSTPAHCNRAHGRMRYIMIYIECKSTAA